MAVFLDVSQVFDKVWYDGLLYKMDYYTTQNHYYTIPFDLYIVIKSCLLHRIFIVKYGKVVIQLKEINSEVP
jgi:hypothetical protein